MRFWAYTRKSLLEAVRDWKLILFTLFFAPCFVFILYAAYGGGNPSFQVAVFNDDAAGAMGHGSEIIGQLQKAAYPDGSPKFKIALPSSEERENTLKQLEKRTQDAVLVLTGEVTNSLENAAAGKPYEPAPYRLYGDPRNSQYTLAAIYLITEIEGYMHGFAPVKLPLTFEEELIGDGSTLTDFDLFVPGLLVLAFLNVSFTAGAAFIKEIEKGTMLRLHLSRLKAGEMIGGISLIQLFLSLVSFVLTLLAARVCGYTWKGSFDAVLLVAFVSVISVLGLTLVAVSFMRSVFDVMTVGMVPYFLVLFFAGIFFPLPSIEIFSVGGAVFRLNDLLPLSLSVSAMNQALNFGSSISGIGLELGYNAAVASLYFGVGLWLFNKRHMMHR